MTAFPSSRWLATALLAAAVASLAACSKRAEPTGVGAAAAPDAAVAVSNRVAPPSAVPDGAAETGIAWKKASSDADVDAAFVQARQERKPVFVYWGAKWCPPCNQLQATLFNRHDFIARSRAFVPVYVDGDSPGAQKLGGRFKVRGYPTMVLFDAQGTELTRLPGEVDAAQYTQVLTLGMGAQRPVKAVLADARAGGAAAGRLTPGDWKLLAFYSWETDEQQLVPRDAVPALLSQLAGACPADQAETAARLLLKSIAAAGAKATAAMATAKPKTNTQPSDPATRTSVLRVLADPAQSRLHMDVLTNSAADLVAALGPPGTPERTRLVDALDQALKRLAADASLSRADRMMAVIAQVDLATPTPAAGKTAAPPALPEALLAAVREHASRADREITNAHERQAVITTAAYMLGQAGLMGESDALLQANLARSHSPYYLMSALAGNAKKRGDTAGALRWYHEAFDKSEGPATRQQWGAAYVSALVELAPKDEARIEAAVQQLLTEAAAQPDAFHERSARSLQRVGSRLQAWNQGGAHQAALQRLQARLDSVCSRLDRADPQRQTCESLLRPAAKPAAA